MIVDNTVNEGAGFLIGQLVRLGFPLCSYYLTIGVMCLQIADVGSV